MNVPLRNHPRLPWIYVGSHNFTRSAWGTLSKKDDENDKRTFIRTKITTFICEACKVAHTPDYETDSSEVYDNLKY